MTNIEKLLKQNSLKVTQARVAILHFLKKHHGPFTSQEIHQKLTGEMDHSTVFRTIQALKEKGLISETKLIDGLQRYELTVDQSHHHHHIQCRSCKKIQVVDLCIFHSFKSKLEKLGFSALKHSVEFSGICAQCR